MFTAKPSAWVSYFPKNVTEYLDVFLLKLIRGFVIESNLVAELDEHFVVREYKSEFGYVRNVGTQLVAPLSTVFADVFNKHTASAKSNILTTSNILDFDVIEDTIWVQTSAETVSERYKYEGKEFKVATSSKTLVLDA